MLHQLDGSFAEKAVVQVYIGVGTVVVVILIVLLIMALRRR